MQISQENHLFNFNLLQAVLFKSENKIYFRRNRATQFFLRTLLKLLNRNKITNQIFCEICALVSTSTTTSLIYYSKVQTYIQGILLLWSAVATLLVANL